jgi:hypothetical protein
VIFSAGIRDDRNQIMPRRVPPAVAEVQPAKLDLPVRQMRELLVIAEVRKPNVPESPKSWRGGRAGKVPEDWRG